MHNCSLYLELKRHVGENNSVLEVLFGTFHDGHEKVYAGTDLSIKLVESKYFSKWSKLCVAWTLGPDSTHEAGIAYYIKLPFQEFISLILGRM